MERIPASERTPERLKALMTGESESADGRSELVRLAARLIIEEALYRRMVVSNAIDNHERGGSSVGRLKDFPLLGGD